MPGNDAREIAALRSDLDELRRGLASVDERLQRLEGTAPPTPGAVPPPRTPPASAASRRSVPGPVARWLRSFLSHGNPLNKLGALSLIVGAAIVFKYAVDNQWLGPTGRVGLGFVVGASLFALGELYSRRGWQVFASGLTGAGNGVLFIAVYFGQQEYGIIPVAPAFCMYVILTAAVVAQSLRYDAVGLALWGLVGGYLTPVLANTGSGNYVLLSSYLLVLNSGVFAVAYHRNWQPLKWMAFLLSVPYTTAWVIEYLDHPHGTRWLELDWLLPYLAVFFLYFAAIPTWRSLFKREPMDIFGQVLTVMNGVVHFALLALLLYEEQRAWLGVVCVMAALVYVLISRQVVRQPRIDTAGLRIFTGTAAAFLLLATPYLATGPAITLVWCAETVFLAWVCTQPRFGFLSMHVIAMLVIISIRLLGYDSLLRPLWVDAARPYLPFTELRSYPAFAAALTFALAARWLRRVSDLRLPLQRVVVVAMLIGVAAVNGEAFRLSHLLIAPLAAPDLQNLIQAGLLVALVTALWFTVVVRGAGEAVPWLATLGITLLLIVWVAKVLVWPGRYATMVHILDAGYGLWWLHFGVLLMLPLLLLFAALLRDVPERVGRLTRDQLQAGCLAVALLVAMLLLRRELFAITHAPPIADLFSDAARQSAYRMLLSLSYALLALGIYLRAMVTQARSRLYAAYGLYLFTAFKVYLFDLEAQNQLFRAFSLLAFAAILFVSSHFANRQSANRQSASRQGTDHAPLA